MSEKKTAIPWSIKGISDEARAMAKEKAAAAGMTIGDWLAREIEAAATAVLTPKPVLPQTLEAAHIEIQDLKAQLLDLKKQQETVV